MRAILLAAVVGLGSTVALAGPSDHASRRFGDVGRDQRHDVRKHERPVKAPFALAGRPVRRRALEYRDVPKGRGQTEPRAFWTWVTE